MITEAKEYLMNRHTGKSPSNIQYNSVPQILSSWLEIVLSTKGVNHKYFKNWIAGSKNLVEFLQL